MYFLNENFEIKIKMYWNKRLNEFTFGKPTLLSPKEAYEIMVNKYSNKEYIETVLDANDIEYNNYYIYSVEVV